MARLFSDYSPICRRHAQTRLNIIGSLGEVYPRLHSFLKQNVHYYKPFFTIMEQIVIPSNEVAYSTKNRPGLIKKIPNLLITELNELNSMKSEEVLIKHAEFYDILLEVLYLPLESVTNFRSTFLEDFIAETGPSLPQIHDEYINFISPVINVGNPLQKISERQNDIDVVFVNIDDQSEIIELEAIECKSSINTFMYSIRKHVEEKSKNGKRDFNKLMYMKEVLDYSRQDIPKCTIGFATYNSLFNIDYLLDIDRDFTHDIFDYVRKNTKIIDREHLLRLVM